jgi:hypothetical protein
MLRVALHYLIYEKCIDILFEKIKKNFVIPIKQNSETLSYEITSFSISDCNDEMMGKCRKVKYSVIVDNGDHRDYTTIFGEATVHDLMEMSPGASESEVLEAAIFASIEYDLNEDEDDYWLPDK